MTTATVKLRLQPLRVRTPIGPLAPVVWMRRIGRLTPVREMAVA